MYHITHAQYICIIQGRLDYFSTCSNSMIIITCRLSHNLFNSLAQLCPSSVINSQETLAITFYASRPRLLMLITFSNSSSAADSNSLMEGFCTIVSTSLQIPSKLNLWRTVFSTVTVLSRASAHPPVLISLLSGRLLRVSAHQYCTILCNTLTAHAEARLPVQYY